MRLRAETDVAAPAGTVWRRLADPAALEGAATARGADVARLDGAGPVAPGAAWRIAFPFHGRPRSLTLRLTEVTAPETLSGVAEGEGLTGQAVVKIDPATPEVTRVTATVDLGATGFQGRLLLQTLKLMRGTLEAKMQDRLDRFARRVGG